ncbi:MAG: VanZ family protein [Bacteroidota bacterium]
MIKKLLKYSLLAALLWTSIIFILCCTPGRYIPTTNWLELLSFDKFVHAGIFFVLMCLWLMHWIHLNKLNTLTILFTAILVISYGGLLEIMQATVFSQRSGDWLDFIANSFGCMMGLWFFYKRKAFLKTQIN